jgi:hypothetical protein
MQYFVRGNEECNTFDSKLDNIRICKFGKRDDITGQ